MSAFWNVWRWVSSFGGGIFFLLIGYRILPVGDDAWHKRNGKFLRIAGLRAS
jgi:hypothetical protein